MTTALRRIALLTGASLLAVARRERSPDAMFGDGHLARLRIAGLL